jgi:hypothetical protein
MAMHKKSKGAARRGMMKSKGAARRGKTNMSKGYSRGGSKARMGTSKIRRNTRKKATNPRLSDQDLKKLKSSPRLSDQDIKKMTSARMGKTKMAAKGGKMTLAKLRKIAGEMDYMLVKKKK